MRTFWKLILRLTGWKINSEIPPELDKYILAVAPHTSNLDFLVGLAVRGAMGFRASYLGKESLFRFPLGIIFRALGGIPVDRRKSNKMVDQISELAKKKDTFILAIAPEGTRKRVNRWRSGFYYIASKSGIPIIFTQLDWGRHEVNFLKPFYPSGDFDRDMPVMRAFFDGIKGYHDR